MRRILIFFLLFTWAARAEPQSYMVVAPVNRWAIHFVFNADRDTVATWHNESDPTQRLVMLGDGSAQYYTGSGSRARKDGSWKQVGDEIHLTFPRATWVAVATPPFESMTRQERGEIINAYKARRRAGQRE